MINNILPKRFALPHLYQPVDDSLIFWMAGTAKQGNPSMVVDLARYKNSGTVNGATWSDSPSNHPCLSFDGVDDYVRIGTASVLDIGTGDLTIEVWLFMNTQTQDYSIIVSKGSTGAALAGYTMDASALPADQRRICISDGQGAPSGSHYVCSPTTVSLNDGLWHHFVGYVNRTTARVGIYLDGKFIGASDIPTTFGSMSNLARNLDIGGNPGSYGFNGKIDEVRIYNRALTPEEIRKSYENSKHLFGY